MLEGVEVGDGERVVVFCDCHEKKLILGRIGEGVGGANCICHRFGLFFGFGMGDIVGDGGGVAVRVWWSIGGIGGVIGGG